MKKTLVALSVAAFATSASALTIYDADGSKIDFNGSIRLILEQEKVKEGDKTTQRAHTNLHNDGSRFDVKMKHELSDDLYAFGRLEFRFNGKTASASDNGTVNVNETTDQFGSLYANRAYVGFGSKQYGELSFGRQVALTDEVAQSSFDQAYGGWSTALTTSGRSVIRYDYNGIENLKIGGHYRFAENRKDNEVENGKLKGGYGVAAIYDLKITEGQNATLGAGYSRDSYATGTNTTHHKDAWGVGLGYTIDALSLGFDYTGSFKKNGSSKETLNGFGVGAQYKVSDKVRVYTDYAFGFVKNQNGSVTESKTTHNKFALGTSYKIHKSVFTYVEGGLHKERTTKGNTKTTKTETFAGVGLRIYW